MIVKHGVCLEHAGVVGLQQLKPFFARSTADDTVVAYDSGSFELAIDPKSLLYLFGMSLDHSTELIGRSGVDAHVGIVLGCSMASPSYLHTSGNAASGANNVIPALC